MPVVIGRSDLIHDPVDPTSLPPDAKRVRGHIVNMIGVLACLSTDSNTSKYHLADLPSRCIVKEAFFDVENWGFAQVVIGTEIVTDALLDVAKSAATTQTITTRGTANHAKELWEMLGLAADPGGNISLWVHAEANATGAGSMPFEIAYLTD